MGQAFSTAPPANQACPALSGGVVSEHMANAQPAVFTQPNPLLGSTIHDQVSCLAYSHRRMTSQTKLPNLGALMSCVATSWFQKQLPITSRM